MVINIPKEKLVQGYRTKDQDFYAYYEEKLVAIAEVKTTITSDSYPTECLGDAKRDLRNYFNSDYKDVKLGIPLIIYLRDLDKDN
ncbi:MAG: hypothetical protein QXF52_07275 [Thermoproteota archaeon]